MWRVAPIQHFPLRVFPPRIATSAANNDAPISPTAASQASAEGPRHQLFVARHPGTNTMVNHVISSDTSGRHLGLNPTGDAPFDFDFFGSTSALFRGSPDTICVL
jgi:hypothetical protein